MSIECSDEFNDTAQSLFDLMTHHIDRGAKLRDGIEVNFGWAEFRVVSVDGTFVFQEPDFDGDPTIDFRMNLDFSLSGYQRQKSLIDALGLGQWDPVKFSDTVIAEQGVVAASRIVAKRIVDPDQRSSWLVCLETSAREKQEITIERLRHSFEQIPVWHLYDTRPALFDALALQVGFQVLIRDNRILQVASDDGQLWSL